MRTERKHIRLWVALTMMTIILSLGESVLALDDGARAYWKGREGANGVSYQYLKMNATASGSQQFAPDQFIYPNAEVDASIAIATWGHHFTLLDRASVFSLNLAGGNVDVNMNVNDAPAGFIPAALTTGAAFSQSAAGYADPSAQLVVNLYGTTRLQSTVDMLNYEPSCTLDVAVMVAAPIGEYDSAKLVNLGLNRWYGRLALPFKYHFGVFTPGYMTSLELTPSVWLFEKNDDFLSHELENDPLLQLEGHLTHDFTPTFYASFDALYRSGFQSEVDGKEAGDELDIGTLGLTLSYQVSDNVAIHTSYASNVFGDDDLDTSLIRLQFVYGWHNTLENVKKLRSGH
jgi:hypothetical protein